MKLQGKNGLVVLVLLVLTLVFAYVFGLLYQSIFGPVSGSFIGARSTWITILGLGFSLTFFSSLIYSFRGMSKGDWYLVVIGLIAIVYFLINTLYSEFVLDLVLLVIAIILGTLLNKLYLKIKKTA